MNSDPASLDRLHDVVMPAPIPWWPPAPGWLVLLAVVAILTVIWLLRAFQRWQRNAYRREALLELDAIETSDQIDKIARINVLLKRVALSVWPREQVASLAGDDWLRFLDRSANTNDFSTGPGRVLSDEAFRGSEQRAINSEPMRLVQIARLWVQTHRTEMAP